MNSRNTGDGGGCSYSAKNGRPFHSWEDYLAWATEKADGSWLFRGQGSKAWPLMPKVGRPDVCGAKGWNESEEVELQSEFGRLARRFMSDGFGQLDILALAQHHGVPTRLLDWTTDPLVGAWFALGAQTKRSTAAVHAIRVPHSKRLGNVDPFGSAAPDVKIAVVPELVARITAQQGCFSVHSQPNLPWDPATSGYTHEIYQFSWRIRDELLTFLDVFGVTAARLMADLDGIGATLRARWHRRVP